MRMTANQCKIVSYNCQNFKANKLMIERLINEYDICFLIEHWLDKNEKYLLNDFKSTHHILFHAHYDKTVNKKGRPFGVCAGL